MIRAKHLSIVSTLLLTSAALSLAGCVDEGELALEEQQPEIVEDLLRAGYSLDSMVVIDEQRVLLDGDFMVGPSRARTMAEAVNGSGTGEGFRATSGFGSNYYPASVQTMCILVDHDIWDNQPNTLRGIRATIADYNKLDLQMSFRAHRYTFNGTPAGCHESIPIIKDDRPGAWTGSLEGFIAYADGAGGVQQNCGVFLNPQYMHNGNSAAYTQGVITHEIGHCMGLRHEDWQTQHSCGSVSPSEPVPGDRWSLTQADLHSIMFACIPQGRSLLSNGDAGALHQLYPKHLSHLAPESTWCQVYPEQAFEGDFNGDGISDRLCHDLTAGTKWIDYGDDGYGSSELSWHTGWCAHEYGRIQIADLDGDARDDVVCHDNQGRTWYDLSRNGFDFSAADWSSTLNWCGHAGAYFDVRDVDGDLRADFICSNEYDDYRWIDFGYNGFKGTDWEGNRANEPVHTAPAQAPHADFCQHHTQQLESGDFDNDGFIDYMCHQRGTGYKWIDWGYDGYTNDLADLTHWDAGWCWQSDEHFHVADVDGDGAEDMICHSEQGNKWIDHAGNGFGGDDWAGHWQCPHQFSVSDTDNDGSADFICDDGVSRRWHDYAFNGFGSTDELVHY